MSQITTAFDPSDPLSRLVYPMLAAGLPPIAGSQVPPTIPPTTSTTLPPGAPTTTTLPGSADPNDPFANDDPFLQSILDAIGQVGTEEDQRTVVPERDIPYHLPPGVPPAGPIGSPYTTSPQAGIYGGFGASQIVSPYTVGQEWTLFRTMDQASIAAIQGDLIRAGMLTNEEVTRPGVWDTNSAAAMGSVMTFANLQGTTWQTSISKLEKTSKAWQKENAKRLAAERAKNGYKKVPFTVTPYTAPDYDTLVAGARQAFREIVGRDPADWELQLYADKLGGWDRENYDAGIEAARQQHYFTEEQNARAQRQADREAAQDEPKPGDASTPWWEVGGTARNRLPREGEIIAGAGEKARAKGGKAKDKSKQPKDITGPAGAKIEDPGASLTNLLLSLYGPEIEAAEDVTEYSSNLSMMRAILGGIEQSIGSTA